MPPLSPPRSPTPFDATAATLQRLALVSGGSRGLGAALCDALELRGFHVVEFSRSAPRPESVRIDLADPIACAPAVAGLLATIDPLSLAELLVINCAGTIEPIGPIWRKSAGQIGTSLAINLVGPLTWLAALLAHFQDSPARKVLAQIGSGAARRAHPGLSLYGAAKAGMEQFLQVLALEQSVLPHPFTVTSIDPGAIDTEMQARLRSAPEADLPQRDDFAARQLSGQLSAPKAVAEAIAAYLLAADLACGSHWRVPRRPPVGTAAPTRAA